MNCYSLKKFPCTVDTSNLENKYFTKGQIEYIFGWMKNLIEDTVHGYANVFKDIKVTDLITE